MTFPAATPGIFRRLALFLGLVLVAIGMLNTLPAIPGLDDLVTGVFGDGVVIRRFSYEYLYPLVFVIMMTTVAFEHSVARDMREKGKSKGLTGLGLALDIALIVAALAIAAGYLIEIDSVCLIDQFTGERAELIAKALQEEKEFAETMGLPVPTSVDDPSCINTLGLWIFPLVACTIATFLAYNVRVWGFPLVMVAILIAAYTLSTVMVWYFFGADDINKYLVTKLGGEPRMLIDGRPNMQDILVNNAQGLLGRFMGILMDTVFPYIVLGSLFGVSAGGRSLIKIAFLWTRRLRGGPAHAAVVSSALFGTISGGPVVNVLSTGVLTIPMMLKRGFKHTFAGGIEAAASSGGQIMPPVMGVAAFVLSAMTVVPYREVIIAAVLPAVAYFGCLFLTVAFQARKQGIEAVGDVTDDMRLTGEDKLHLVMIFGPILLILVLLLIPKEAVGCGPLAGLWGVTQIISENGCRAENLPWLLQLIQNSAGDAGSAGWWATALLVVLFFLDREIRQSPGKIVTALADAGLLVSRLYLMFLAVSVIDFCLNLTGLSNYVAVDIIGWLRDSGGIIGDNAFFMLLALAATMLMAILLGMGMPTVPAYINVALLMGPMLVGLGIATFTAHMFIFYFAVASAITPPVAVAAFAAASITKADPMRTGVAAVRAGVVIFVVPFIFAFYPELLLIEAAQLNPEAGAARYLPGLDGTVHPLHLAMVFGRVMLALYLLASVLARFEARPIGRWESWARLALAVLVLMKIPLLSLIGIAGAIGIILWHWRGKTLDPVAEH
ncbi:TRAP transporter, 4TM/12TM fusion protein [Thalassovita litoralis]|jgi:TRAP transporter 4TM/12TM fusion protein|uniref:TRAP transporter, 4TM/12TM fusion protein n=1 Tax=Thalassovita litoralis TaxID=1010611 RepID=A0A521B2J7_9RHOB|nr:TRAP transporter fused permease subunit [Thalassovita litoralis]SMO41323.1 TRAP transporter, 4TM/12TM fusion protein [Thalassovita litoralis]